MTTLPTGKDNWTTNIDRHRQTYMAERARAEYELKFMHWKLCPAKTKFITTRIHSEHIAISIHLINNPEALSKLIRRTR